LCVDVAGKLRFEGCPDAAQTVPYNTVKERMLLDFVGTTDAA